MTDYKNTIIDALSILEKTSKSETAGIFKSRTYAKAIKTIRELPAVTSLADLPQGKGIGLGEKVLAKISEILETGSLASAKAALLKAPDSLEIFTKIYGVGPKKAAEFVAAGYRTIDDLRKKMPPLTKNQTVGLRVYEDLLERIPRAEMEAHEAILKSYLPSAILVGSYRRGAATSGDIDVFVPNTGFNMRQLVKPLKEMGYITDILAEGESKCLAVVKLQGLHRRLDILLTPPAEMPFAILYFTGSAEFNVVMRQRALERGLSLNEHGLLHLKTNKMIMGCNTEKDIFTVLKMDWKEPHERII